MNKTTKALVAKIAQAARGIETSLPKEAMALVRVGQQLSAPTQVRTAVWEAPYDDFVKKIHDSMEKASGADLPKDAKAIVGQGIKEVAKHLDDYEFDKAGTSARHTADKLNDLVRGNNEEESGVSDEDLDAAAAEWELIEDEITEWTTPADAVKIKVSDREDDPFTLMLEIHDPLASKWADDHGSLDGGTWESADGPDFVYDHAGKRPGIFEEWKKEGYDLDLSDASDDPYEDFRDLDPEELEKKMNEYTTIGLHEDDDLKQNIRDEVLGKDQPLKHNPDQLTLPGVKMRESQVKAARKLLEAAKKAMS